MLNMQDTCHVAHPTTHPMTTRSQANIFKPKPMFPGIIKYPLPKALLATQTHGLHEPTCYTEASKSPEWRIAMNQEFIALLKNGTWTLVPPNPHSNVVGCKWVFRIKRKADGSIESLVIKPITIRIVLSLAVASNWDIRQLDVTNAFLHGNLSEDVYMTQPPGFVHSSYPTHVCHLRKALYGLKQAPRAWYSRLSNRLLHLGFHGSHKTTSSMYLSQRRYISDLLQKTNMHEAKPVSSPMSSNTVLSQHSGTSLSDSSAYRSVVGSLQYLSLTRPDIAFAVNKVCQFMHNPTEDHWSAVKPFSDADWASCPDDRRSTTGYCLYLGRNLLSWTSRKQRTVSRSSTESEYRAVAQAATEIVWLQSLLSELGILPSTPPILWCDNIGATYLAANPIFHARTKHIEIDVHYVRDLVSAKALSIRFVSSKDQIADTFTKPLPTTKFNLLRDNLNVRELPLGLRGRIGTTTSLVQSDTPKLSDKDKLQEG
uniref:Reverse transcriptase Ty1/copia-type domain-containing protein n=1 Tax=Fagus sylvatica TaxID=28930 RepID=A0A2N9EH56_FAGSY